MVVLKEDTRGVGTSDLIKWCRERLTPYKIPDSIEFRDMFPNIIAHLEGKIERAKPLQNNISPS